MLISLNDFFYGFLKLKELILIQFHYWSDNSYVRIVFYINNCSDLKNVKQLYYIYDLQFLGAVLLVLSKTKKQKLYSWRNFFIEILKSHVTMSSILEVAKQLHHRFIVAPLEMFKKLKSLPSTFTVKVQFYNKLNNQSSRTKY